MTDLGAFATFASFPIVHFWLKMSADCSHNTCLIIQKITCVTFRECIFEKHIIDYKILTIKV